MFKIHDFESSLDSYLSIKNWNKKECIACGRTYYTKKNTNSCQSLPCEGKFLFLLDPKPRRHKTIDVIWTAAKEHFIPAGYVRTQINDMVNRKGNTLFILAGIQIFDGIIHGHESVSTQRFFIGQPSIRLKYLPRVGRREGYSTAFVNVCSEQISGSLNDFTTHLNDWLDYLSIVGLYAGDLTLIIEKKDLKNRQFEYGKILTFNYGGIVLGEGIIATFPSNTSIAGQSVIDFGFGLERICWAVNKVESYYSFLEPIAESVDGKYKLVDIIRTITLIASSGITPSNRGHGYRFRSLVSILCKEFATIDLERLVLHSYSYWSKFIKPLISVNDTMRIIRKEIDREKNIALCDKLGISLRSEDVNCSTDEFLSNLIVRGIRLDGLLKH